MIKTLGIDPGLVKTGWAVIESHNQKYSIVASGIIKTSNKKVQTTAQNDIDSRIHNIFCSLKDIIGEYKPLYAGIENTYVNTNFASSLKLAQARAASILACCEQSLPLIECPSKSIKKIITGNGNASKEQVLSMLKFYFSQEIQIINSSSLDESDAISIALYTAITYGA